MVHFEAKIKGFVTFQKWQIPFGTFNKFAGALIKLEGEWFFAPVDFFRRVLRRAGVITHLKWKALVLLNFGLKIAIS